MICKNCRVVFDDQFKFCPHCGEKADVVDGVVCQQETSIQSIVYSTDNKVIKAFKSGLFLVWCIFALISCITYFLPPIPAIMFVKGFPIINIIFTFFSCCAYVSARKNIFPEKQICNTSKMVSVCYVIISALSIAIAVIGLLLLTLLFSKDLSINVDSFVEPSFYISDEYMRKIIVISSITTFIGGGLVFVINRFFFKRVHLFLKSIQESVTKPNTPIIFAKTTICALIVLAIAEFLFGLFNTNHSVYTIMWHAYNSLTILLLATWVNKNFT